MSGDVPAQFVATYYRTLYDNPDQMHKFYDSNAIITRQSIDSTNKFTLCLEPNAPLCPFDSKRYAARILSYSAHNSDEGFVVYVFGSISNAHGEFSFSQNFILQSRYLRWFVISDSYFVFDTQSNQSYTQDRIEVQPSHVDLNMPIHAAKVGPPQPQHIAAVQVKPNIPRKQSRLELMPQDRSITISNLNYSYNGEQIVQAYNELSPVSDYYCTHKTAFIAFATIEGREHALAQNIQPWQGNTARVDRGIIGIEPKRYSSKFR